MDPAPGPDAALTQTALTQPGATSLIRLVWPDWLIGLLDQAA
jgi:hypothetical protein